MPVLFCSRAPTHLCTTLVRTLLQHVFYHAASLARGFCFDGVRAETVGPGVRTLSWRAGGLVLISPCDWNATRTRNVSIEARIFYSTVAVAQDYRLPFPLLQQLAPSTVFCTMCVRLAASRPETSLELSMGVELSTRDEACLTHACHCGNDVGVQETSTPAAVLLCEVRPTGWRCTVRV